MSSKDIIVLKELFEEKFKGLHLQMDTEFALLNERINSTNTILERVEQQTIRTNGRVTALEEKVSKVTTAETLHIVNCPNTEEIKKLKENQLEYNFIKKYPKLTIGAIAIIVILFIIGTYTTVSKINFNTKAVNTNTQAIYKNDSLLINQ